MEYQTGVSHGKPEINYDLARSQMSERYRIYSDAFESIILERGLKKLLNEVEDSIGPVNRTSQKAEQIRTLLLEED